jgi:hypothetical protein
MLKKAFLMIFMSFAVQAQNYSSDYILPTAPETVRGGGAPCNLLVNCSFETGDSTGWVVNDLTSPHIPFTITPDNFDPGFSFFFSAATDGAFSAVNGFDGSGPGVIELAQDITLPVNVTSVSFDYRGAWDLQGFGASLDRTFTVEVQPSGGGAAMQSDLILTATAGDLVLDTGPLNAVIDLSSFAGQNVRLSLLWNIPENFTGPGFFQVDNFVGGFQTPPTSVPSLNIYSLLLLGLLMFAMMVLFRNKLSR